MKILIIGSTGMLGMELAEIFSFWFGRSSVFTTVRNQSATDGVSCFFLDATTPNFAEIPDAAFDYVINAVGVIKPYIYGDDSKSILNTIKVNSEFPHLLAEWTSRIGARTIQIATDCVFSGDRGRYLESDSHDALDAYGKSKSLGEVNSPHFMNIRSSVIGREYSHFQSLVSWVQRQPQNASITGYTDHLWNGVTTKAFSRVCAGIIATNGFSPGTHHLVPSNDVTKDALVRLIAARLGRSDIAISSGVSGKRVDMTLATNKPEVNSALWSAAKYENIPSIEDLVAEL